MISRQDRWQEDLSVVGSLEDLVPKGHILRRIDRPGIDAEAALRLDRSRPQNQREIGTAFNQNHCAAWKIDPDRA
jgi:hypothetical protein